MIKLLKIEFLKLRKYFVFWFIVAAYFFLLILILLSAGKIIIKFSYESQPIINFINFFQFPYIWNTNAWLASWINHFWALFIIIFIGYEINNKTFRLQYLAGLSPMNLFGAKFLVAVILPLIATILIYFISLLQGLSFTEGETLNLIWQQSYYPLLFYIQAIGYIAFAWFIISMFRSPGLSIVFYLLSFILEGILRLFASFYLPKEIIHLFPLKVINNIITAPPISVGLEGLNDVFGQPVDIIPLQYRLPIAIVYIIGLFYLAYLPFKNKKF